MAKASKAHESLAKPNTCGARTRAGTACKRRDLYRGGRCRLHGGLSTGRPITTGEWTKEAIAQRKEVSQLIREMKDMIVT